MGKTNLTHAELGALLSYDPNTGVFISRVHRKKLHPGDIVGNHNDRGYLRASIDYKSYYLHRLAWFFVYKRWPRQSLDHINGVLDDNRIANLRECDCVLNGRNRKRDIRNSSGKTGVFCLNNGTYRADIKLPHKRLILGSFPTFDMAVEARIAAEIQYFGEFRRVGS